MGLQRRGPRGGRGGMVAGDSQAEEEKWSEVGESMTLSAAVVELAEV